MLSGYGALRLRLFLVVVLGVGLGVVPHASAEVSQPATVLVLDASAGTLSSDLGGPKPIDAERAGVEGLLGQLPPEQLVGLVAFGTQTGVAPEDREAGCGDAQTLMPLGTDRPGFVDRLRGVAPRGYRPLGAALLQAERELPAEGPRQIVLVSAGADMCAPPPACDVAREVKQRVGDVVIHTIGLNVDEQARGELRCIAEAGGGGYADASDAASLESNLALKVSQVAPNYRAGGERVSGTPEAEGAPELRLGGLAAADGGHGGEVPQPAHYQDVLPRNAALHYKVKVNKGERFVFGFVTPPPAMAGNDVGIYMKQKVDIFDSTGRDCAEDQGVSSISDGFSRPSAGFAVSKEVDDSDVFACKPGALDVVVSREGALGAESELPVEFMLWKLPRVVPQTFDSSPVSAPPVSSSAPMPAPDLSFGDSQGPLPGAAGPQEAPLVQPGVFDAQLAPGDMVWFKVPVQEGQRLQLKLETPRVEPPEPPEPPEPAPEDVPEDAPPAEEVPTDTASTDPAANAPVAAHPVADPEPEPNPDVSVGGFLEWIVLSPVLVPVDAETFTDNAWQPTYALFTSAEQPKQAVSLTAPITWGNAEAGRYHRGFLAGEQYVAVRFNSFEGSAFEGARALPFRLAVEVQGEPGKAPKFTYGEIADEVPGLQASGRRGVVSFVVKVLLGVMGFGFVVVLAVGVFVLVRRRRG